MERSIQLVPFPPGDYGILWGWLNEHPECNFDDSGPKSEEEFASRMERRRASGCELWEVVQLGQPVGVIGWNPVERKFEGICFTESVHGSGVAFEACCAVLERVFERWAGVVRAAYFADNKRVDGLFRKLGAVERLQIESNVRQSGKVMVWKIVEIDEPSFREHRKRRSYQGLSAEVPCLQSTA